MLAQVLAFNVEWFDSNAQIVRNYRLNCYNDETLELVRLKSLPSMPDLSSLTDLKVKGLPANLKPWEDGGRKRFSL